MLLDTPVRRGLRLALAFVAVGSLLAACGGDDDDASSDDTEEGDDATTTTEGGSGDSGGDSVTDDVCGELTAEEVSDTTGLDLTSVEGTGGGCTYTSAAGAFIAVSITDVGGADTDLVMQGARAGCSGDAEDLDVDGADDAFTCESSGITIVGAAGNGVLVVASGVNTAGGEAPFVEALAGLLELALEDG